MSDLLRVTLPLVFCKNVLDFEAAEQLSRQFVKGELDEEGYEKALNEQLRVDREGEKKMWQRIAATTKGIAANEVAKDKDYLQRCKAAGVNPEVLG